VEPWGKRWRAGDPEAEAVTLGRSQAQAVMIQISLNAPAAVGWGLGRQAVGSGLPPDSWGACSPPPELAFGDLRQPLPL